MARARIVGVVGQGSCDAELAAAAAELGAALARRGCVVLTGGRGGVMEAASRGAAEAGGLVVGVLPGPEADAANPWVEVALATGLGEARNAVIATAADALVAIGGAWGTLSEIALARKRGKPVFALKSRWLVDPEVVEVATPEEAAERAAAAAGAREA